MDRRSHVAQRATGYLPASMECLIDQLPMPLVAVVADGEITHASPGFDAMLGRKQGFTSGRSLQSVLTPDSNRMIGTGETVPAFLRRSFGLLVGFRYRDGSVVQAIVGLPVLLSCADHLLLVSFDDVTEQLWTGNFTATVGSIALDATERGY